MADDRTVTISGFGTRASIVAALGFGLLLSACNNAGNSIAKFVQADQARARLQTEQAREKALARLAPREQKELLAVPPKTLASNNKKSFRPNLFRMLKRNTVGEPASFEKPVAVAETQVPIPSGPEDTTTKAAKASDGKAANVALLDKSDPKKPADVSKTVSEAQKVVKQAITIESGAPLARFRTKLAALKAGTRTKPVTILHIGDSHVASDSFSQGIRRALQAQYGDAGRGAVIPAGAFKYGFTDQVSQVRKGHWKADTALKNRKGSFGIAGVNVASASTSASLNLKSKTGSFDAATVTVATGPRQGAFTLKVGNVSKKFNARAAKVGSKTFRLEAKGEAVQLNPAGGGTTRVFHWSTEKNTAGIRYVSFGLIGATVDITKRFNMKLVAGDMRSLDPDLIVYGYGTNEGFNDNLNLKSYRKYAAKFLDTLERAAPNADTVIIGAADGLRRRSRNAKSCGGGWYLPPKLGPLRVTMKQLANERNAGYWDWSAAMGGKCSANRWAAKGLAARDRVHLKAKGYSKSAIAFAAWLSGDNVKPIRVASNR